MRNKTIVLIKAVIASACLGMAINCPYPPTEAILYGLALYFSLGAIIVGVGAQR